MDRAIGIWFSVDILVMYSASEVEGGIKKALEIRSVISKVAAGVGLRQLHTNAGGGGN